MNILQLLPKLEVGGVERGTVDLARHLALNGHKAVVISGGGTLVRDLEKFKVKHYRLPIGQKSPLKAFLMIRKVKDIIEKENIDIVHARSRVPALIGFFAARATNRVFLTTAHGYYKKHLISRVMGWGKFVIVASNVIAKYMNEDFGVPDERIRLIPRGVDLDKFKFEPLKDRKSKEFKIGIISRITPLKGHDTFVEAIAILHRIMPNARAVIVGEPPSKKQKYMDDIKLLVKRSGLTSVVEFMGGRSDIPEILSQLDVLVSSTKTPEAFGRVIIEAQAKGVPVVATRVGGVVDIIKDGENGLLCPAEDPKAMADAILRLSKDKQLREKLTLNGRRNVEEKFKLEGMFKRTLDVYNESLKKTDILVIKVSSIGDVILVTPSLKAIREKYPQANIYVLVGLAAKDLLVGCPYINGLVLYDDKGRDRGLAGLLSVARRLRSWNFDIVIDFQNNRKSHLLSFLSMGRHRYGYGRRKLGFLLNHKVKEPKGKGKSYDVIGPVEHQFKVLELLGINIKQDERLELWPVQNNERWADDFLQANWANRSKPLIGMSVGASLRWFSKRWPTDNFVRFCDEAAKKFQARVVLTGTKEDLAECMKIASLSKSKPIVAAGKTDLMQLVSLIKRCDVFITPDSATMHISAAVNVPFVTLFGPTDPLRHTPPNAEAIILKQDLPCSPCYSSKCARGYICMKKITVEEVLDSVRKLLERRSDKFVLNAQSKDS